MIFIPANIWYRDLNYLMRGEDMSAHKPLRAKESQDPSLKRVLKDPVALAGHYLRTPATTIRQYMSMLRDGYFGELTDTQKEMLDVALQSSDDQLRVIDELLTNARTS